MIERIISLILTERNWFTVSMSLAIIATTVMLYSQRNAAIPTRRRMLAAMTLFFGVTIGTMAFGHLLAVTTKVALRTLERPAPIFYLIGIAIAAPSWSLIRHTRRVLASENHAHMTLGLNAWLAITLLALGVHNLPLALPAFLNIAYHLHFRRMIGTAIVGMAVVVNTVLFIGSLIFLASGQDFEQFSGVD